MLLGSPVFTGRSGGGALGQLLGEGADCDVACGSQGGLTVLPLSPRPVGKSLWPAFSIETGLPGRQDVTNRSGFSVAQAWQRHSREAVQPVQEAAQLPLSTSQVGYGRMRRTMDVPFGTCRHCPVRAALTSEDARGLDFS